MNRYMLYNFGVSVDSSCLFNICFGSVFLGCQSTLRVSFIHREFVLSLFCRLLLNNNILTACLIENEPKRHCVHQAINYLNGEETRSYLHY